MGKLEKYARLFILSTWVGTLLPEEQKRLARKLGLEDLTTFSKWNIGPCYVIPLSLGHAPLVYAALSTNESLVDYGAFFNLGSSLFTESLRAYASFKPEIEKNFPYLEMCRRYAWGYYDKAKEEIELLMPKNYRMVTSKLDKFVHPLISDGREPTPAISIPSAAINTIHFGIKGAAASIKKKKAA